MNPNIIGKIRVHPFKGKWLDFYLWDDLDLMRDHTGMKDAIACYRSPHFRIQVANNGELRLINRKLGEIHLVKGMFGIGIVVHEIQHFLSLIFEAFDWDIGGVQWEDASYLAGDVNEAFWTGYIKEFGQPEFGVV